MLYKQHSTAHKIPSCKFTFKDLAILVELCERQHLECVKQLKDEIFSGKFIQEGFNISDRPSTEQKIDANFKMIIEIFGDDGEYINVLSLSEIKSRVDLPNKISKIRLNNNAMYEYYFHKKPSTHFDITIDFQVAEIFDLISAPYPLIG